MRCYHRTNHSQEILATGFIDGEGTYLTKSLHRGVWFSDVPLDINEGADGDVLLALDIPGEVFAKYEWIEDWKPYRESLIPASIANTFGLLVVVDDEYDLQDEDA